MHAGTEQAAVQLSCGRSSSSTHVPNTHIIPVRVSAPGVTCPTVGGWCRGTGERKENVEKPLSHPTFISRAGFQHLGKERNKRKGACRRKGDVTLPRSAWAFELLYDGGRKTISVCSSVFPLCSLSSDSDLQLVFVGPWQKNGAHRFVFLLFRNSYTHQPRRIRFPFLREKVKG